MEQNRDPISLIKVGLRKKLKQIRFGLDASCRNKASEAISEAVDKYLNANNIAAYCPMNNEVDITRYLRGLKNKKLALPVIENQEMIFREWLLESNLLMNKWSTLEPDPSVGRVVIPEIIIVPMLGFDRKNHRLGYGFGYYDKVLRSYPSALSIGIAFSVQEVENIPSEAHDVALNLIITEKEVIKNADKKFGTENKARLNKT
ncbi:MAG: 5-formyltetrahydrofolate cyclo-ligase [Candidatus Midichloria mitochondrii]|uniref:5-formyltetrahydrofolate cyclo-ligase n=1 Tax=Midichloria mitochondrii (strain IricVA) TaxID=696127 RepID=F7XVS5_MIDMI|nr:5-formyltetrahydrofolate cyclo-ligase [Candidatus Midichloria mitochondrii]AEI88774.1 5-formyltetrahydrofolate cyclo-ligase [Candidatus Midichloria mitochondrii IricVA]MDJ1256626.1 5-formyltetrahydrofolate cyclo-ligase [Candidatus Midichloria mitochondrii]MDJ1288374.1 5-formyltetrahydrofolate cyclo-ligase [Candidatus Midichloria mitochondrii]MDJ1299212.1 5-formyltetrahydrofolate cyclo-ligase [Candidatus Midichloria mitochondrii]MDJ1313315.1 5-formyltetrahydrofolate cyclo-ligase [Candidatus 